MIARILILSAALLALRSPAWRPIAVVLGGSLASDVVVPLLELPARHDLALWLACPALSAWGAWRVLERDELAAERALLAWCAVGLLVIYLPAPRSWWPAVTLLARPASIVSQVVAAARWWRSRRPGEPRDAAALVLLAGDLVSLLGPAGLVPDPTGSWWVPTAQAGVVAAGIAWLQIREKRC